jgi:cell division septation protein DedD
MQRRGEMSAFAAVSHQSSLSVGRAACALAVICAAAGLGAPPAAAACGQTTQVNPERALGPGPPPLAVGDSVLYAVAPTLAGDGFESNAMVCRTMAQGIDWLLARRRPLPSLVVVALGTNGTVSSGQVDELLRIVGPNRTLALVTPHHGVSAGVPGLFRAAARHYPGEILLLDWDRLSAAHTDWFAPDGIHLGGAAGIAAYAHLIASALVASPANIQPPTGAPATTGTASTPKPPSKVKPAAPATPASARKPSSSRQLISIHGLAWSVLLAAVVRAVTFSGS